MVKPNDEERALQQAAAREAPPPAVEPDLEQVFREHSQRVLSAAYRVTRSAQDAEDVLQTVFMRLLRREGGAVISGNPAPYLHRAAINAGMDIVRSRRASRATPLDDVEPVLADDATRAPSEIQRSGEIRELVLQALAEQSPRSAEIFILRYFEGYDNHEIADMLGTSRSTIAVILHRTRQRLREAIRPHVGDRS